MDKYLSLFCGELDMAFDAERLFSEHHPESEDQKTAEIKKLLANKTKIIHDKNINPLKQTMSKRRFATE